MVSLGSSFAAGPGIRPVVNKAAGRSARNYPHLIASALGVELVDATVAGATTATILDKSQWTIGRRFRPQIDAVDATADLVTVTAGGNDLGYMSGILATAVGRQLKGRALTRGLGNVLHSRARTPDAASLSAAAAGLERVVEEVHRRAPSARVVLVGYLPIFDPEPTDAVTARFTPDEIARFLRIADQLAEVYAEASMRTGAVLVPADAYEAGHGVGSADPWINDLQSWRKFSGSFHPNAAGMTAVAQTVLRSSETAA